MSDLHQQLQSTLGNAYTIERELGGGGISRVFLATEQSFGRLVVVKVLPSERVSSGLSRSSSSLCGHWSSARSANCASWRPGWACDHLSSASALPERCQTSSDSLWLRRVRRVQVVQT